MNGWLLLGASAGLWVVLAGLGLFRLIGWLLGAG